jgi:2-oxoglutarate ferredoxin oxidoreductase subunit alpha
MESITILDNTELKHIEEVETVTIRFAGDSGDGMQLTGTQFTNTTAVVGNDISTLPDFPAEIRAPAGSLPGVSGFQLNFSNHDIRTPGDEPNVLVAMNPAALKVNIERLPVVQASDQHSKSGSVAGCCKTSAKGHRSLQELLGARPDVLVV